MHNSTAPSGVRLVHSLRGHTAEITGLAWSPDGTRLASGSHDGTIRLWDTDSGAETDRIELHEDPASLNRYVWAIAFSPDGSTLASGANRGIDLWEIAAGRSLKATEDACYALAFDPRGAVLASGHLDGPIKVWDAATGMQVHELIGHTSGVGGIASDAAGTLATAGWDDVARLWDIGEGREIAVLDGHDGDVNGVSFSPEGDVLVTAGDDATLKLWDPNNGTLLSTLEGHTHHVMDVTFMWDGSLIVSKGRDETVRVWDIETGACLAVIPLVTQPETISWLPGIAAHPRLPLFAVGENTQSPDGRSFTVTVWEIDRARLQATPRPRSVTYSTAKIVLVGDSGVGKTGLGWRLAHDAFKEQASTHGQQFWALEQLETVRSDGTQCEAILWDLAGQPDYRLIHALFLDDADLALVLYDPTRDDEPLRGVEYWLRQLDIAPARAAPGVGTRTAMLVGARSDRGSSRITPDEIEAFCAQRGIHGHVTTSALTGDGVDDLLERIRAAITWDDRPTTVTTETFKRIKELVLELKEQRQADVVVTSGQLRERLEGGAQFTDDELLSAVGHLAHHGYVTRLTTSAGEPRILLAPELLNNVASSLILEARRNPKGLGSLEEARVLTGDYEFPELRTLSDADRDVLLDSAITRFLEHNLCFRQTDPLTGRVYLVFPELINLKKPSVEETHALEDGVSYSATGAVENVYASLVVLLGYTGTFTRTNQWRANARYVVGDDLICGFRQEADRAGELELVLYFGTNVGEPIRTLFQSLFETFLSRRDVTVRRYDPARCANGHVLNRSAVRENLADGIGHMFCPRCGDRVELPDANAPIQLSREQAGDLDAEQRLTTLRSRFERAVFRLSAYVTQEDIESPECFISYAWGDPAHERWVETQLATDLAKAGIAVVLDRWENARIGASVPRFLERVHHADRVLVVGTPRYRTKYDNAEPMRGFAVAAEGDLIGWRMIGSEEVKQSVLPVLVDGDPEEALPPLLLGRVFADFRRPEGYFSAVLGLLLTMYDIPPRHPVGAELLAIVTESRG